MRRVLRFFLIFAGIIAIGLTSWAAWSYHGPATAVEIFRGITYGCERLPDTPESHGLLHWIRADLTVPGVSIYTTPLDAEAEEHGFEYRLQHTSAFVTKNRLAAAVNGALFMSDADWVRLPGDLAISTETIVSDHVANHVDPNTYLLWWDDQNNGHLQLTKPPSTAVLAKARWGIGGQMAMLAPDWVPDHGIADQRTAIGIDPAKKLVWIACFDRASYRFVALSLRAHGAVYGTMVDGGTSMAMVVGKGAKNVRPGTVTGNWRPVATHVGFRADPLP